MLMGGEGLLIISCLFFVTVVGIVNSMKIMRHRNKVFMEMCSH